MVMGHPIKTISAFFIVRFFNFFGLPSNPPLENPVNRSAADILLSFFGWSGFAVLPNSADMYTSAHTYHMFEYYKCTLVVGHPHSQEQVVIFAFPTEVLQHLHNSSLNVPHISWCHDCCVVLFVVIALGNPFDLTL